jgi:hypothetical protein
MSSRFSPSALLVAALLVGAACTEVATGPQEHTAVAPQDAGWYDGGDLFNDPLLWYRRAYVCKIGSAATFEVSVDGGSPVEHSLADGECKLVHYNTGDVDEVDVVTVTELSSVDTKLDSITVDSTHGATITRLPTIVGTTTVAVTTTRSKGAILTFYNSAIPHFSGGQGCTPGYWKQSQHFDSWTAPYTPNTLFSDVFDDAFPGKTLLQVVSKGGGGLDALGRHTVAALLNAASADVSYDYPTPADVIAGFNGAYPGPSSLYEFLKNEFEKYNEQGCPLN